MNTPTFAPLLFKMSLLPLIVRGHEKYSNFLYSGEGRGGAQQPNSGQECHTLLSFLNGTQLDVRIQWHSSEQMKSSSHRPLPAQHTANSIDKTSMPLAGFEHTISTIMRPQTYALECTATGISSNWAYLPQSCCCIFGEKRDTDRSGDDIQETEICTIFDEHKDV
jgi:hypothetical protein